MRRTALLLLLLLLALWPAASLAAQPLTVRLAQVDPSAYPQIALYVSVQDQAGQPVLNLQASDFTVTEDGQPVELSAFAPPGGAISAALVIDRSGSMEHAGKLRGAQRAAEAFVHEMRAADRTALIGFNDEVQRVQGFTGAQEQLLEAIDELEADGGTALYDALIAGVRELEQRPGRRALVLLSDGADMQHQEPEYGSQATLDQAIEIALEAGQPVYVIGLGNRAQPGDRESGIDEAVLRRIAEETGGQYLYAPDAETLVELYRNLAGNLHSEYRLTYSSPRPFFDGTRRDIRIDVAGIGLQGEYLEQHLIQVRSQPLLAGLLALPLLMLLLLPALLQRKPSQPLLALNPASGAQDAPAIRPMSAPATRLPPIPAELRRCVRCDEPLRPQARFCSSCGAAQEEPQP